MDATRYSAEYEASDELVRWKWVDSDESATYAKQKDPITEAMRLGHGLLSHEQFVHCLQLGEIEIILLPNRCAALVAWGRTQAGRSLAILTVYGHMSVCEEALQVLEIAAKEAGAKEISSVGRAGWRRMMERNGYTVQPVIYMRKQLS